MTSDLLTSDPTYFVLLRDALNSSDTVYFAITPHY